jgi:hypothetical protein
MIVPAFLAFAAAVGLADLAGPGHQWGGLALLIGWFFVSRSMSLGVVRCCYASALALSVAIAVLAVVQMWWMPRARGPFASPNFLGAYAVLMFFLAVAAGRTRSVVSHGAECNGETEIQTVASCRYWSRPTALANLLSLALSQSRGAILALGAGLAVMSLGVVRRRWASLAAVACCCASLGVAIAIRPGVDEARWEIWRLGWQAAMLRPVTGWGQGGLVIGGLDVFYSIPLEVFIESGILGVAAGAWVLAEAVRKCLNDVKERANRDQRNHGESKPRPHLGSIGDHALLAFLAAWLVQGLFLFSIPTTNVLLVTVLAYLASEHRNVADRARGVDDDEPALNGRMRAGGAD